MLDHWNILPVTRTNCIWVTPRAFSMECLRVSSDKRKVALVGPASREGSRLMRYLRDFTKELTSTVALR
jgi:hypothetical protein